MNTFVVVLSVFIFPPVAITAGVVIVYALVQFVRGIRGNATSQPKE